MSWPTKKLLRTAAGSRRIELTTGTHSNGFSAEWLCGSDDSTVL